MDNQVPASASNTPKGNPFDQPTKLPRVTEDQLIMAGAHFGHLTQRWNPKMRPYILTARNGIYLLDMGKTESLIEEACNAIVRIAVKGDEILFVGTKKQARDVIEEQAVRSVSPYVTFRWLGGMLTNFATIRRSLKTLETYERMALDGTFEKINKKERLTIERSKTKLDRVLGGIREMHRLPGGIFVVDIRKEAIAVAEARKLGIPVFAIVDTNANPNKVDYPIPANDDAYKSIWLISQAITDSILEGKKQIQDVRKPSRPFGDREGKGDREGREGRDGRGKPKKSRPGDRSRGRSQKDQRNAPAPASASDPKKKNPEGDRSSPKPRGSAGPKRKPGGSGRGGSDNRPQRASGPPKKKGTEQK